MQPAVFGSFERYLHGPHPGVPSLNMHSNFNDILAVAPDTLPELSAAAPFHAAACLCSHLAEMLSTKQGGTSCSGDLGQPRPVAMCGEELLSSFACAPAH